MASANQQPEPSMDEILASIRRIITDGGDESNSVNAPMDDHGVDAVHDNGSIETEVWEPTFDRADIPMPPPTPDANVLHLSENLYAKELPLPAADPSPINTPPPAGDDTATVEQTAAMLDTSSPVLAPPDVDVELDVGVDMLLSSGPGDAVNAAFQDLSNSVLDSGSRTLDEIVKELLRPMLRTWLDDNLPPLVERLVRQEIERVSRGR
jgi:cell pole-organizing protein PopZ